MELPNRIREIRKYLSLTLDCVAKIVGCSTVQMSDLERGKRRLDLVWMQRIAKALNVSVADLLPHEDSPHGLREEELRLIGQYRQVPDRMKEAIHAVLAAAKP